MSLTITKRVTKLMASIILIDARNVASNSIRKLSTNLSMLFSVPKRPASYLTNYTDKQVTPAYIQDAT